MNAQIKKLTQAFPAFRLRLADNKRWALMAGVGLAVAATAIIVAWIRMFSKFRAEKNLPLIRPKMTQMMTNMRKMFGLE